MPSSNPASNSSVWGSLLSMSNTDLALRSSKLWAKANPAPHVLVMTATPIPRTLAMTAYGDLDVSIIDEMPPGRKPIKTVHRTDEARLSVFQFMEDEIKRGRQVYVVYPLIEKAPPGSQGLDGRLRKPIQAVPAPRFPHRNRPWPNEARSEGHGDGAFANGTSHILVATTVIEVGVNVPNASVMVIESAERFGLAQLHQLRGRVGRGAEQSYCILMTGNELSKDGRRRLETMCRTNDGFELAEVDMELRGPGDLMGTQQLACRTSKWQTVARPGTAHHRPVHWDPHSRRGSAPRIAFLRYPQSCADVHNKAGRIGAESPELGSMNWQRGLTVGGVIAAVLGSAAWVLDSAAQPQYVDPTDVVSDAFDHWEQPAAWPNGLVVQDSCRAR